MPSWDGGLLSLVAWSCQDMVKLAGNVENQEYARKRGATSRAHSTGHLQRRAPMALRVPRRRGVRTKTGGGRAQVAARDEKKLWGHENGLGGRKRCILAQNLTGRVCPGYGEWVGRGRRYSLASNREQDHVEMDQGDLSNLPLFPPQKPL